MSGARPPTCCAVSILVVLVLIVEEDVKIARRTNLLTIHNLLGTDFGLIKIEYKLVWYSTDLICLGKNLFLEEIPPYTIVISKSKFPPSKVRHDGLPV